MKLVTVRVPDNAIKLLYTEINENWETEPAPVTFERIVSVKDEDEGE